MRTLFIFTGVLALAVTAISCATAMREQSGPQTEWNEQYRSELEVPVSKIYTGRSPYMRSRPKWPVPAPAQAPKLTSSAEGGAKPPLKEAIAEDRTWGLIRLTETMPAEATLGGEFAVDLSLTAQGSAANVVLRDIIPTNAIYVRSEPPAKVEGVQLVWELGNLDAGQILRARIWFKAEQEGTIVNCATVTANPRVCATTVVGKPILAIDKSGPETAVLGADVTYDIVVKNTGTGTVRNVVVTDPVPTGLSHASGKSELTFAVGDLAPGQSKTLAATFKAIQRGQVCNTATASSSNAGKVSKNACTVILAPSLKVENSGTKEQILGRNADYEIVVSNLGDTTLRDLVVSDLAATESSIVAAPGAALTGNKATWKIAELKPGAKHSVTIKLTSKVAGTHCNTVTVSGGGLRDEAKICTLWKGMAAVMLEVVDDPDPIQVGESTSYTIRVLNQGSADIHNLKVTARFGDQVTPFNTAQGRITGKLVEFPAVASLAAKHSQTYKISVKGSSVGDSRNKITLTCEELRSPVEEEESTTVY